MTPLAFMPARGGSPNGRTAVGGVDTGCPAPDATHVGPPEGARRPGLHPVLAHRPGSGAAPDAGQQRPVGTATIA